uniref:Long-chain-alcohol oxidase n=1 Tax=Cajanus cajan TaxID=3821 RepID=A0A151QTP6_CAJCA|nr:putative GMC-type oxidoreductase Rv0492c/MT0511/MT0512 family [Cajanus cajan]
MKSLVALCDTIVPSIDNNLVASLHEPVANFYRTSSSMAGTPHHLGILISEKMKHPRTWLLLLTLWLLSTWFGTFILCGMASLSTKFPFFQSFPDMSLQKRQKVMQSWSLSYFRLLRMLFRTIKLLTLLVFFTQLDEAEDNPSWEAIGYCGPDPEFKAQLKNHFFHGTSNEGGQEEKEVEEVRGPLYKGLVHINNPRDIIADSLRQFGFSVSTTPIKAKASNMSSPSLVIQCDAVVVGSGSGGGVVAGVLANAGYKVLVLEKGSYYARNNLSLLEGPSMDQMYLSRGLVATDDMSVLILAGSTVGGGSAINWSASIKTPQHVCKEWCERYELELFESMLYREALDAVCDKMGVQSEIEEEGFNNAVLRKGCVEMGYPVMAFAIEQKGSKDICVVESKVTIVACGALSTPALLKRSGLKNENIGRHLHLHPVAMAWGYFPDSPSPIQTPALHPGMFSILTPWTSGMDIKDRMRKFSRTAHVLALARDQGSGTVNSPTCISYQLKDVDKENLKMGIEKVLRILAAAGAEEIGTHNNKGKSLNVKKVSYNELEKFVKEESSRPFTDLSTPLCSAHQMGSCKMGNNPKESVVNQMGETWEVEDLYLADTSVFPSALGVNPMVTVQAIAYCTAQYILQVLRRKIK